MDLVKKLRMRVAALRELARCTIVTADGREALNAAADLYEARAEMMERREAV